MNWEEISPEEEEVLIHEMAQHIWRYGMETAAIMFLETSKPIAYIGAQMGQAVLLPLLNFMGDVPLEKGDKYLKVLQKKDCLENLIQVLEYIAIHEELPPLKLSERIKPEEKLDESQESKPDESEKAKQKWWKKFLPF
jgi:hypothetical protein